ncbi:MAG: molybdenum cofactor guanylyltransferase MobA [Pseudomonadota bacterium]
MNSPLGVILAGGLSRRMDGPEKSLIQLGDMPLIGHVASNLGSQTESIIINANGDPERFFSLSLPVQPDVVDGFVGPLAGVLSGMRWAKENTDATHIITAAADTPFFPRDYVSRMIKNAETSNAQIVLASSEGRRHPVFGFWPVDLADPLEHFLVDEENRKVMLFVERYANNTEEFQSGSPDPFFNVNTPDDLAAAQTYYESGMGNL